MSRPTTAVDLGARFGRTILTGGDLYCRGDDTSGQLALDTESRTAVPVSVAFL